jgi:HK97 family phage prohead protease
MTTVATIPFHWTLSGKAAPAVEVDHGDLLIEGWCLRFDETDRENERWLENGVLLRSIEKFVQGNAPVCHHHDYRTVLGRAVSADYVPGKGIKVKAIIDHQPPGSPWRHLYEAVKRGRLANLSFGGIFKREQTAKGPVLVDADFLELSVCGTSVGRGTSFAVVAGKALTAVPGYGVGGADDLSDLRARLEILELDAVSLRLNRLLETLR